MAQTRDFLLPDLGEGLEDAVLVEWHAEIGERVGLNQPLCTVETAKATVEIPSPFAGVLAERAGAPGDTIDVGSLLFRIEVEGATPGSEPTGRSDEPAAAPPAADSSELATEPVPDQAPAPARDFGARTPTLVGYGPDDGPARRRRRPSTAVAPDGGAIEVEGAPAEVDVLAKPPVRKLARDLGVDLAALAPGSGKGGTITRDDVRRAAGATPEPAPLAYTVPDAAPMAAVTLAGPPTGRIAPGSVVPVEGIRARIADRISQSRREIPDASCSVTVDCGRLLDLRATLREAAAERVGEDVLTPFAMILRLVVTALQARPILNSRLDLEAGEIRVHDAIHLGVGAATDRGLVVPVVRHAEQLSTLGMAAEVRRLADGARTGTLAPAELVGSTFTVSNFGVFGLDEGYPVINYPEVAILGIGAIRPRPAVVEGELVARPLVSLACCFDHRVCDGADAGAFLAALRDSIEAPERLLLDV